MWKHQQDIISSKGKKNGGLKCYMQQTHHHTNKGTDYSVRDLHHKAVDLNVYSGYDAETLCKESGRARIKNLVHCHLC